MPSISVMNGIFK